MFLGETKKGKEREDISKKVQQCRKDVGQGHEKYEKEICIVKERKTAVKEAGMEAKAGLMGQMKRHKRGLWGEIYADRVKDSVRIRWIKTTCVCLR